MWHRKQLTNRFSLLVDIKTKLLSYFYGSKTSENRQILALRKELSNNRGTLHKIEHKYVEKMLITSI